MQSIIAHHSRRRSSLGQDVDSSTLNSLIGTLSENAKIDGGIRFDKLLGTLLNGVSLEKAHVEFV